jgi:hypothetical protein
MYEIEVAVYKSIEHILFFSELELLPQSFCVSIHVHC